MAAEITQINPQDFISQGYESQDLNLLTPFDVNTFLSSSSYIELFIYDNNRNIIALDENFTQYTIQNDGQSVGNDENISKIILDPEKTLIEFGFDQGTYVTYFNFLNNSIGSFNQPLYITEVSSDRTEIRLDSTSLTDLDIIEQTNTFIQERENSTYFLDFYLNFGENQLYIANNILLDDEDPLNPTILIKLYEPLPEIFDINSQLWVVTSVEESQAYQVTFQDIPIIINDTTSLKGPNFNLDLKDQVNNSTLNLSYSDLISSPLTSSQQQLNSLLGEKEININIDYTNFSDFIHFSSAKTRIENFYYKVGLIEEYYSSINILNNTTNNNPSASIAIYQSKIDNIITNFDGYDYYLYYSTGSFSYPKSNTELPYQLFPSNSPTVLSWLGSDNPDNPYYGGILLSASIYDQNNKDNLYFVIPEYLREDPNNDPYLLFVDMVGQHYDNIWIYYKDVTQKYNADNRLEYGISKDIVADAIRDFGVKLYQNNFSNVDLYTAFLGLTPDGALFPFPEITGSLPSPTGFEYVNTLISASNDYMPLDDVNKSLYKRIYHNLPYLLKAKGTLPGLRALITSYGIPDTILRINEYGGKDKVDSNDWDYWQNEFNYAFKTNGDNFISSSWDINTDWGSTQPSTVLFRFKTNGLPETNIPYSQSLWNKGNKVHITLTYTGSGYNSGSYSGSIKDPYYQYATLTLYPAYNSNPSISSSIYLPFFDGEWWSVMAKKTGSVYELHSGNKIYEGGDNGTILGFYATSSTSVVSTDWTSSGISYFASSSVINGSTYNSFSGSLQEIRYYQHPNFNSLLGDSEFKDYIMNPYSIEGNILNSEPNELVFRASLGGELYTGSTSIHPKVTGSWIPTSSFISNSNFYFNSTPTFIPNTEYFFYDQPIAGIRNTVSDKIRIEGNTLPTGSTLSPFRRLEQVTEASSSYTPNINYLEVAFSPQNEINEDIMDQLGFFNIGDYIGNPSERFSGNSYPDLDNLRNAYFEKYTKNYDLVDFIRLIKFFDNSLFKMIKDFVPARTSLASGVVIKQHLLERNKYPQPQVSWEKNEYSGSIEVGEFNGGTGGSVEIFNNIDTSPYGIDGNGPSNMFGITQSWNETYQTLSGSVTVVHDSQEEFYDGEFSGSVILVTTQSLNQPYPLENISFEYSPVLYRNGLYGVASSSTFAQSQFLNILTVPNVGEILILAPYRQVINIFDGTLSPPNPPFPYIKINKIDNNGNDNTNPLGQLDKILIKYTANTSYTEYFIEDIIEYPTYYTYQLTPVNISFSGAGIDTEIKNYYTSASITTPYNLSTGQEKIIVNWDNELGDSLSYFNTSSGILTFNNTPNIPIYITSSLTTSGSISSTGIFSLRQLRNGVESIITSQNHNVGTLTTSTISSSIFPLKGDQYYLVITRGSFSTGFLQVSSSQLLITQSISPTSSFQDPIILEPYITSPNFYNSDQNAILNNAFEDRLSTIYQDVDYSTGVITPTNFSGLISGSATKAPVQDSNYTTKRHIIPRYEGSKSTSQFLNIWSNGDEGTYGKLPTIESLKTYVAYSDTIGGYPPEKMNTSGIIIKYLISEDGDLVTPNISLNSLEINQQTFESGERLIIESLGASTNSSQEYKTIFRGGSKIEPILTNQIGHPLTTTMSFASEISFTDDNPSSTLTVGDYMATLVPSAILYPTPLVWDDMNFSNILSSGSDITTELNTSSEYIIPSSGLAPEISNLVFNINVKLQNTSANITEAQNSTGYVRLIRDRGGSLTSMGQGYANGTGDIPFNSIANVIFSVTVPRNETQPGDKFYLQVLVAHFFVLCLTNSTFKISQIPLPTPTIPTSGLFYTSSGFYSNSIITTSSILLQYYNNPQTHQEDIPNSGFNPITLPFTVEVGDEFRFEGDETKTFIVKSVDYGTLGGISYLIINFPNQISGSNINVNQFLHRRYIDSAGSIIFDGYKTSGLEGPYLIKPEYMSDKMEQNIGKYIEDLTNKGLL